MNELWLLPLCILTATLSGVTGFGGGTILIVAMSEFWAPKVLIPTHGAVQFASNASRAWFSRHGLRYDLILKYSLGAICGAVLGSLLVIRMPSQLLWVLLGAYLIFATWLPTPNLSLLAQIRLPKYELIGLVSTFLSLFVGVTGPLLHPIMLRENLEKEEFIGSEAACCCITHLLKVVSYAVVGAQFLHHLPLIFGLIICAIAGSYIGKKILGHMTRGQFYVLIKVVVTLMAVRMLIKGLESTFNGISL